MKKRLTNNIGLKMLAFLIAVFMWLIVVNIDDPIMDKTYTGITVSVINEDVVTDNNRTYQIVDNTQTVNVVVSAKRSILSKIKSDDISATADMKELTMGTQVPIEVSISGYTGRYESAYSNPRNLQVKIDDEAKNSFPITPMTTGTPRGGNVVGGLTADPEKVTIRGPKTVINEISKVVAEANVSGLSEDSKVEAKLVLYDANDNVIDQTLLEKNLGKEGVSVNVELYQIKNVPVKIDTSLISAESGYTIEDISVEPQEIGIAGSKADLAEIDEINIPAEELEVSGLTERTEETVDVTPYLPQNIMLADENAGNVVVTINVGQPGTQTYEVSTASITVNNLADGLDISYGTTVDLAIQVRGASDVLKQFTIAKKVSIDLKDYTDPGTYYVPVQVNLPDGCTLVNDLKVEVVLEKRSDNTTDGNDDSSGS